MDDATGTSGSGTATITDSDIAANSAQRAGGGIEAVGGSQTTIAFTIIDDNIAGPNPGNGGGLHLTGTGTVDISDSEVADNDAANEGGGLWNSAAGTMTVQRSVISDNSLFGGSTPGRGQSRRHHDAGQLHRDQPSHQRGVLRQRGQRGRQRGGRL